VYTTYGIHYLPSRFLSSQHNTRVVPSSVTCFITNAFNNDIVVVPFSKTYVTIFLQTQKMGTLYLVCAFTLPEIPVAVLTFKACSLLPSPLLPSSDLPQVTFPGHEKYSPISSWYKFVVFYPTVLFGLI